MHTTCTICIDFLSTGAVLHVHDAAMIDVHWIIDNFTYMPNLYMCFDDNAVLNLHFYKQPPTTKGIKDFFNIFFCFQFYAAY